MSAVQNRYKVGIYANDNTKEGADKAKKRLALVGQEADRFSVKLSKAGGTSVLGGLRGVARVMGAVEKSTSKAFGRGSVMEKVENKLSTVTTGLKNVAEAGAGMEGAIGGAAIGLGVLAGAAVAAVAGGAKLVQTWIDGAAALGRFSTAQGIALKDLQAFQAAGEQKGIDKNTTATTMAGLKQNLFDAENGRNQGLAYAVSHFGLKVNRDSRGEIDVADFVAQLSKQVNGQKNQSAKHTVAGAFGAEGIFNLLDQSPEELKASLDWSRKNAPSLGMDGAKAAMSASAEETKLKQRFERRLSEAGEAVVTKGNIGGVIGAVGGALDGAAHTFDMAVKGFAPGAEKIFAAGGKLLDGATKIASAVTRSALGGLELAAGGMSTLGIRNNNPGNIRPVGRGGFNQYSTMQDGLVGMGRQLLIDQDRHHLNTISGIVSRWAPPSDHNDTPGYIRNVASRTGFGADQALDLHNPQTMASLMAAMIAQEQGRNPFSREQLLAVIETLLARRPGGGERLEVDVRVHGSQHATVTTKTTRPQGGQTLHAMDGSGV